jgi:catechol 2,3-dioxygenase-like lactoylglutathione lyase family enzyme
MPPTFQAIPIFRIFDVEKAKEFYVGFLGFHVDWEARFDETAPLYFQISRDGLLLHLSEHHGDACPGSTVTVQVAGPAGRLETYHREITAKGYRFMRPGIELAPWNARVMEVIDPFGNRLRFNEPVDPAPR